MGELNGIQRENQGFAVFLTYNFNAVGRTIFGAHIGRKAVANPSPTGFLTAPFDAAARIGKLFTIVESAARPDDSISEVTAGTLEKVACGKWMRLS